MDEKPTDAVLIAKDTAVQVSQTGSLVKQALESGASIEVIEKLTALMTAERTDWRRQEFNTAMAKAQSEMLPISADATNPQTRSKYASYAKLDSKLRPIYTSHDFALSFDTKPISGEEVRVICIVSHAGGFEREYSIDMPTDGKGAKGNAVMTKTHATGSGVAYGMRYLLKMIFNVAVGEYDDDGNKAGSKAISTANIDTIKTMQDDAGFNDVRKKGMLTSLGCKDISEIPADKFSDVCDTLQKHINKNKKEVESCM